MKKALFVFLMVVAFSLLAEQPRDVEPWQLSIDERIRLRLDPAAIEGRRQVWLAEQPRSGDARRATIGTGHPFVIDGKRNPELLLPFELMDFLLSGVSGPLERQLAFRRTISDEILAAGWRHDEFWTEMERIRAGSLRESASERREAVAEPLTDERVQCALLARALRMARETFGREAFDRFLYRAVAPKITAVADVPMSATQLRAAEEGCR